MRIKACRSEIATNQRSFLIASCALLIYLFGGYYRIWAQQPIWTTTGSLHTARSGHTATVLQNGKVLVVGGLIGCKSNCDETNSAELYDPATGLWNVVASAHWPRFQHAAVRLTDGRVLVVGGVGPPSRLVLTAVEVYDPGTGTWSLTGDLKTGHPEPQATLLADGKVLLTGFGHSFNPDNPSEIYDPVTGHWSFTGKTSFGYGPHTANLLPSGKVLVATGALIFFFPTAEVYDPATNNWSMTGSLTTPRTYHAAVSLNTGKVLIAGGLVEGRNVISSTELYDPVVGRWQETGKMIVNRVQHALTVLRNGKVLASGGVTELFGNQLKNAELYDPATGSWLRTANANLARNKHTASLLANGKVLVVGGNDNAGLLDSAELFDSDPPAIANLSAASFLFGQFAPEAIVAAFGTNLAANTQTAAGLPLPMQLAGVSLRVRDSAGVERIAPLFFVSPSQINYQIPLGTANGPATVIVSSGAIGNIEIVSVAPGLFTADANGQGLVAAIALRIRPDGTRSFEPVARFDAMSNRSVAVPVDVSNPAEQVYLILFGTGFRQRSSLAGVQAQIGGVLSEVSFAGAQGDLVGVDQCNVRLSPSLAGHGESNIELMVDGKAANTVKLWIR